MASTTATAGESRMKTRRIPPREREYLQVKSRLVTLWLNKEKGDITALETVERIALELYLEQMEFDRRIERNLFKTPAV